MMGATSSEKGKQAAVRRAKEIPEVPRGTPETGYPRRMNCATAAQLIGLSVSYMRHLTADGRCPAVYRHGKRVTYDRDLLLSWNPAAR